jgi:phytoene desaturase
VLEKNDGVGGKMGRVQVDGFTWDTGPSVITMRHVFEDLFAAAGRSLDDYLELLPVDPLTRYFYPDGSVLDVSADADVMDRRIQELSPGDARGYRRFLRYASRLHRITGPAFIYGEPPSWKSLLRVPPWDALRIDPLRTMQRSIEGFVRAPQLRQLLGRFATYVGASPYLAPATLNVIADVELNGGVWYPRGGIYAIAEALGRLARELGVDVRTGTTVERIIVEGRRASGVLLPGGELLRASAVIANVDVATVYRHLLHGQSVDSSRAHRLETAETSCSGFILLLGVRGRTAALAHHNIFFSTDYQREFREIFEDGVPPSEPTVYVAVTSKTDPWHAPEGHENLFVLVNAPPLGGFDWESGAPAYRDRVQATLAARGIEVRGRIVSERMFTPADIERMTGAYRGALYGVSSNSRWTAFRRTHNRSSDIPGLYFAGGTTHPGGGVPMVMLSGALAARYVLEQGAEEVRGITRNNKE